MNCFGRGFFGCFGFFLIFAGIAGAWQMSADWRQSRASRNWPSTSGVILWSGAKPRQSARRGFTAGFDFVVEYEYRVRDKTFKATRADWSTISKTERDIARLLRKYPPRRKVQVFYNPRDPKTACLEPNSFNGTSVWAYPFFSILVCVGLLFSVLALEKIAGKFVKRGK